MNSENPEKSVRAERHARPVAGASETSALIIRPHGVSEWTLSPGGGPRADEASGRSQACCSLAGEPWEATLPL